MVEARKTFRLFITSTVARKYVMSLTGLFLVMFLLIHASLNALIFVYPQDGAVFNEAAHFMSSNPLMRILEVVLFLGFILHIVQAVILARQNKAARKISYNKTDRQASTWYSRSMGLLGTVILLFLITHLYHFWTKTKFGIPHTLPLLPSGQHDLWQEMCLVFSNPYVVVLYVLSCVALAYHLMHGVHSAFQSLGLRHRKYTPWIKKIGYVYAIVISLVYASIPVYVYFFTGK